MFSFKYVDMLTQVCVVKKKGQVTKRPIKKTHPVFVHRLMRPREGGRERTAWGGQSRDYSLGRVSSVEKCPSQIM